MANQTKLIFGQPTLRRDNSAIIFPAGYAGENWAYKCVVTSELLINHFNASPSGLLESYENNKTQIQEIAQELIVSGNIELNNDVLVTTEAFKGDSNG